MSEQSPAGSFGEADEAVSDEASRVVVDIGGDQRCDSGCGIGGDGAHLLGERGIVARCSAEQQSESVEVGSNPPEVGAEPPNGGVLAVDSIGSGLVDGGAHTSTDLIEERREEIIFRIKMLVEHRFGDAGRFGNVVHGCAVETSGGEHLEGDVEQLVASFIRGESRGAHVRRCYVAIVADVRSRSRRAMPYMRCWRAGAARSCSASRFAVVALGCFHCIAEHDGRSQ